ncbi:MULTISPECIES: Cof-type HAD-IIB family hydrolase [unclassified Exiguobacterium]|uniref:Cof-type HAD-IIB family hydrolase n=1 Tax=unclassified Exiguobacterium TaxID=2644629 RepID=UPI001BE9382E|nr:MULTISPECIES: Cof-type HAD-IIB family hydrolase [unclassified Exiguobacterium]
MSRYLIAVDLDGTLLRDDKTISERNVRALQAAREAGHEVMIATGRPQRHSIMYYEELGLTTPLINFNGALVHHPKDPSYEVTHRPIPLKTAHEIIEEVSDTKAHNIVVEVTDHVYFHKDPQEFYSPYAERALSVTSGNLLKHLQDEPTSLLIHATKEHVDNVRARLNKVHAEAVLNRQWRMPEHMIEVMSQNTSKALGLREVSKHLGINRKNIIAFGDEENDLEMLDYVGTGVAMGNAISQLKAVADEVTASNMEDGIAIYLEEKLGIKA